MVRGAARESSVVSMVAECILLIYPQIVVWKVVAKLSVRFRSTNYRD